jgi:hypothetical protein
MMDGLGSAFGPAIGTLLVPTGERLRASSVGCCPASTTSFFSANSSMLEVRNLTAGCAAGQAAAKPPLLLASPRRDIGPMLPDLEQPPLLFEAIQGMLACIVEFNARACNQILYRSRNDHLAGRGRVHDACG